MHWHAISQLVMTSSEMRFHVMPCTGLQYTFTVYDDDTVCGAINKMIYLNIWKYFVLSLGSFLYTSGHIRRLSKIVTTSYYNTSLWVHINLKFGCSPNWTCSIIEIKNMICHIYFCVHNMYVCPSLKWPL